MNEYKQASKTPSLIIREAVLDSELTAEEGIGNGRNDASKFDMGDDELMDKLEENVSFQQSDKIDIDFIAGKDEEEKNMVKTCKEKCRRLKKSKSSPIYIKKPLKFASDMDHEESGDKTEFNHQNN